MRVPDGALAADRRAVAGQRRKNINAARELSRDQRATKTRRIVQGAVANVRITGLEGSQAHGIGHIVHREGHRQRDDGHAVLALEPGLRMLRASSASRSRYPCALSQRNSRSRLADASVSMPSATTFSPKPCPISIAERTTVANSGSDSRPCMKLRSIFTSCDRHARQMAQRGITGAEVIDRQTHAQRGDGVEHEQRARRIFDEAALGQLQGEQRRRQLMAAQQRSDARIKTRIGDVLGTDVHRQIQRTAGAMPLRSLRERMIERPARQPADESGLFGERNEVRRSQQASCRMLPAQQHFGTGDAIRCASSIFG